MKAIRELSRSALGREGKVSGDLMATIGVHRYRSVSAMILLFAAILHLHAQSAKGETSERSIHPVLINTCVVTENVKRLVGFYESILGQKAKWSGDDYAEFATGVAVLAIFSYSAQERYIPQSAAAARNRSVILEFKVVDVDAEYRRLKGIVKTWVKPPTTQPWGTRSIYFRDPDGNLVDFYSPVSASPR
jgi:catechol 2,3-dioxygenase-like lactoylglutathione lyase family enzyme